MRIIAILGYDIPEDKPLDTVIGQEHLDDEDDEDMDFLDAITGKLYADLPTEVQEQVRDHLLKDAIENEVLGDGISYEIVNPGVSACKCPSCGDKNISTSFKDIDTNIGDLTEDCICNSCGCRFSNYYILRNQETQEMRD